MRLKQHGICMWIGFVSQQEMPVCVRKTLDMQMRAHARKVKARPKNVSYFWFPYINSNPAPACAGAKYYLKKES